VPSAVGEASGGPYVEFRWARRCLSLGDAGDPNDGVRSETHRAALRKGVRTDTTNLTLDKTEALENDELSTRLRQAEACPLLKAGDSPPFHRGERSAP